MVANITIIEPAYSTKEAAAKVGIAASTVRKYSQILEDAGYSFTKNGDVRIFAEKDIEALNTMKSSEGNLEKTAREIVFKLQNITPLDLSLTSKEEAPDQNRGYQQLWFELEALKAEQVALKTQYTEILKAVHDLRREHRQTEDRGIRSIE